MIEKHGENKLMDDVSILTFKLTRCLAGGKTDEAFQLLERHCGYAALRAYNRYSSVIAEDPALARRAIALRTALDVLKYVRKRVVKMLPIAISTAMLLTIASKKAREIAAETGSRNRHRTARLDEALDTPANDSQMDEAVGGYDSVSLSIAEKKIPGIFNY